MNQGQAARRARSAMLMLGNGRGVVRQIAWCAAPAPVRAARPGAATVDSPAERRRWQAARRWRERHRRYVGRSRRERYVGGCNTSAGAPRRVPSSVCRKYRHLHDKVLLVHDGLSDPPRRRTSHAVRASFPLFYFFFGLCPSVSLHFGAHPAEEHG